MSVEHGPQGHETNERSQAEINELGRERLEELATNPEAAAEHQEQRAEQAREAIEHHAEPEPQPTNPTEPVRPTFAAKLDHVLNYTQTVASVQRRLSPVSRSFSKLIHTPAVEATSEALEATVMRPSVITGALWSAAIVGLVFYLVARHYGFALSGFEMLAALIGGAVLGLLIEGAGRLMRRR